MLYGVINIFGKGEKEPISSNDEENRRVELIVEEEWLFFMINIVVK